MSDQRMPGACPTRPSELDRVSEEVVRGPLLLYGRAPTRGAGIPQGTRPSRSDGGSAHLGASASACHQCGEYFGWNQDSRKAARSACCGHPVRVRALPIWVVGPQRVVRGHAVRGGPRRTAAGPWAGCSGFVMGWSMLLDRCSPRSANRHRHRRLNSTSSQPLFDG